jgi:hypothetical protein
MFRTVTNCLLLAALTTAGAAHAHLNEIFQGGETVTLRGLVVSESTTADLAFVNRAKTANRCSLSLAAADGSSLGPEVTLTLEAFETRSFPDVFEHLTQLYDNAEAKATISCARPFYAHGTLADAVTGRLDPIAPEVDYEAAPSRVLTAKAIACPAGATCYDAPGVVHVPTVAKPDGRLAFPAPAGVARRFRASLDVTVGPWYPEAPSAKHLIYWFVVSKNIDMPGMLYFRGPGKSEAFARHGIRLTHPDKLKVIKPFTAEVGRTYRVDNDYDMTRKTLKITVTDLTTGQVKVTLNAKPNVTSYTVKPNAKLLVDMGFVPGLNPTEVPSYGWTYANVHVEAFVK